MACDNSDAAELIMMRKQNQFGSFKTFVCPITLLQRVETTQLTQMKLHDTAVNSTKFNTRAIAVVRPI